MIAREDLSSLARVLAKVVRKFVAKELEPIKARLASAADASRTAHIEERLAVIERRYTEQARHLRNLEVRIRDARIRDEELCDEWRNRLHHDAERIERSS
jgi:hypothetical protein